LFSPNKGVGFTSMRGYLQPMAVFILARAIRPSREQLRMLLILLLNVGVIMVAFELWQVYGWTEVDYSDRGYLRQNGELVSPTIQVSGQPYIRPTSTVSGPNELGISMLLLSMGAFFGALYFDGRLRILLGLLTPFLILGVMLTFSRSAILGLIVAILAATILLLKPRPTSVEDKGVRRGYKTLVFITGVILLVFLSLVVSGNLRRISYTLSRLTQEYHIQDSLDATRFLIENPGGVGMGMVEPKGALALMAAESLYHVEGSLFQIAMEMSVLGLVIWSAFWCVGLVQIWREWVGLRQPGLRVLTGTAFTGWIGALVAFVFLPLMQSISLMVWLWFFFGLALESQRIESMWEDRDRITSSSTPSTT
ncbi:MAG: O-antigen ligase family protein, partial [Anaerolineales bacterium]|nr:O-antigen ligase family protein [Anaerolineales bacterium]